jgi:hypothetical protein
MKPACINKEWLFNKDGQFMGVCLGADWVAEHEHGIADLKMEFGIISHQSSLTSKIFGLEARKTHRVPDSFKVIKKDGYSSIGVHDNPRYLENVMKDGINTIETLKYSFVALWDRKSFQLIAKPEDEAKMEMLVNAIKDFDLAIFLGGGGVFTNGGLTMVVASMMSQEMKEGMWKEDENQYRLTVAAEKTGIFKELKSAGKEFFALSPRWKDEQEKVLELYLNPRDQRSYNSGRFNLEELRQWIKNEGPIIQKKKEETTKSPNI